MSPFVRALAGLLPAVLLAVVPIARAATLRWIDPAGGNASNPAKWSPAQRPVAGDEARFDTTGTYTVVWDSLVDSVGSLRHRGGDVTHTYSAPHDVATQFSVAQGVNDIATVRLTSGTLRAGWSLLVGTGSGSNGVLLVDGPSSDLLQNSGPGTPLASLGGAGGAGELRIERGGLVSLADRLNIGIGSGGDAHVRVRGQSAAPGSRRSQLLADAATADVHVGLNGSMGGLEVLEGGLLRVQRRLWGGERPGDSASIVVAGRGSLDSSRLVAAGDLLLGVNRSTAGAAGWARLVLDSLGVVEVADSTELGDVAGGDAALTLLRGSRFLTRHLAIQQTTGSPLDLRGGLLQVLGGTLRAATDRLVLAGHSKAPVVELLSGAGASFSGTPASPPLEVGTVDDIELKLSRSALVATGGPLTFGSGAAATAKLTLLDGSHLATDQEIVLGAGGRAVATLTGGSTLSAFGASIGAAGPLTSLVTVADAATFTSFDAIALGSAAGTAQVTLQSGGVLDLPVSFDTHVIWPSSVLRVNDTGRVDLAGFLSVRGEAHVNGGSLQGGLVSLIAAGALHGRGEVASGVVGYDTASVVAAEGPMTLGSAAIPLGFDYTGRLEVGAHDVTLWDPDSARVGRVTLAGGSLRAPAGGAVLTADRRLTGHGTLHGPWLPRGIIKSSGGELRIAGTLRGIGAGVSADSMRFLAGGGFEGAGVLDGRVRCDSGSVIVATGDLTIGRILPNPLGNALLLRGRIETGPHDVVLANDWNPSVSGTIVLGGGTLSTVNTGLIVGPFGSRLEGRGRVLQNWSGNTQHSPGPGAGRLGFAGTLNIGYQARFVADLGDHAAGEHDTIAVIGALSFGSDAVLELRRLPSFAALPGDSFRVIEHGSRTGTFTTVTLDGAPAAGAIEVHYNSDGVWVVLLPGILDAGEGTRPDAGVRALRFSSFGSPGRQLGVELALPAAMRASVDVFDVNGRRLSTLHDGMLAAGLHRLALPRGIGGAGVLFARAMLGEGAARSVRTVRLVRLD